MMRQCKNCGREVVVGTRCNNCYMYRREHGVERPVELEQQRVASKSNDSGKCTNCERPIPNKNPLCHTCYIWTQRYNGEMRPVECELRLKNPMVHLQKPKRCGKCQYLRRKYKNPAFECASCKMKRAWSEGRFANRQYTPRADDWTEVHINRLRQLAGNFSTETIAKMLTEEFGFQRTKRSVQLQAHKYRISLMYSVNMTIGQVAYVLTISDETVYKFIKHGLLTAHKESGKYRAPWHITPAALEQFIRAYPYVLDIKKIKSKRLRYIAEGEYVRNPWFHRTEVGKYLGVCQSLVDRYIAQGLLETPFNTGKIDRRACRKVVVYRRSLYEFMKSRDNNNGSIIRRPTRESSDEGMAALQYATVE